LLSDPITKLELAMTLSSMKDSAPGPDGISYSFYSKFWDIFGQLLTDAWEYSIRTGTLTQSHRESYLTLIPKAGKDLSSLGNWRPITLANCDHKIITKTYTIRLSKILQNHISPQQTAYLKSRQITDNIRAIHDLIKLSNRDSKIKGLLIALDAKKAFDSVSHGYLAEVLDAFGLSKFKSIFKVLYSNLSNRIIYNRRSMKSFNIERGIKQGDALSCLIFIMAMEPLLRNLECNTLIKRVHSDSVSNIPKGFAYADDVNLMISADIQSVQSSFQEYERFSIRSGLYLNAEKTEIMYFGTKCNPNLNIKYNGQNHLLVPTQVIKVNGVFISQDDAMDRYNLEQVIKRMDSQFGSWSRRQLTLLGRIQILKTYGISQITILNAMYPS